MNYPAAIHGVIRACPACPVEFPTGREHSSGVAPADGTGVICEICPQCLCMDLTKYHNRAPTNVLLLCQRNYNAWQAGLWIKIEISRGSAVWTLFHLTGFQKRQIDLFCFCNHRLKLHTLKGGASR